MPDVEAELDRLYALPLEEFTQARNDLARRLAKAGSKDAADEVKKLAKPSIPVWTANQLARREPGEVRALLRSAEELRKAQQRALARLGRDILADEGRSVSDAIVERIAKTLDAAALDEGTRFQLRGGRLAEEPEAAGFDALAGMASAAPARTTPRKAPAAGRRERVAEARKAVQSARREAREESRRAAAAERDAARAESAAQAARHEAEQARERAEAAERSVAEAEAALRDAES